MRKIVIKIINIIKILPTNLVLYWRCNSTTLKPISIIILSTLSMLIYTYCTKNIINFFNQGAYIDVLIRTEINTMVAPELAAEGPNVYSLILKYIFERGFHYGGVGFSPNGKLIICNEVFDDDVFIYGLMVVLDDACREQKLPFRFLSEQFGGPLTHEQAGQALDKVIAEFQEYMAKDDKVFAPALNSRAELHEYYSKNIQHYKNTPMGKNIELFMFNKYIYLYVAAGFITGYLAYQIGEPCIGYTMDMIIQTYYPPNP